MQTLQALIFRKGAKDHARKDEPSHSAESTNGPREQGSSHKTDDGRVWNFSLERMLWLHGRLPFCQYVAVETERALTQV